MTNIVPAEPVRAVEQVQEPALPDVPASWVAAMRLAGRIHNTPFVPKSMRGQPHTVLACILYGEEVGLGPMQSLNGIQVIDGRPGASPELMRALVGRAGHELKLEEHTDERCTLWGRNKTTGATATVTWDISRAVTAQLCTIKDGKPYARSKEGRRLPWETYPASMLLARATSQLCRAIFAEVVKGLSYTPEEAAAIEGGVWEPGDDALVDPVTHVPVDPEPALDEWDDPSEHLDDPTPILPLDNEAG